MNKRTVFVSILLLLTIFLSGETLNLTINNKDIDIITVEEGVRILQSESYYSGNKLDPSIPLLTHYFEIPEFTKIESITVKPLSIKDIKLDKPLLIQPEQVIMSNSNYSVTAPESFKSTKLFPDQWDYNFGSSISGSKNIGYLAIYSSGYDATEQTILLPESFSVEISLTSHPEARTTRDSKITNLFHQKLGFAGSRESEQETYLLIYPQEFTSAYQPLINWRKKQGLNVISSSVEDILTSSQGVDAAEKIRNFIIDKYATEGVDYVTLGADTSYIMERRLWAFDCAYGMADENNIPGDIYYANLDGNWNANGNELYGEDDDEVDHFPEVIVGRLPVYGSATEATAMVNKLIAYEQGHYPDYSQGLGLSVNLWDDSNSVYAQEYIEDMYYNDFINNVILNEQENTVDNAQANFNRNPTIIQHTGHCFWSVIALGVGSINSTFVNNMTNDYAGVMYSIGCWTVAIDFDAISEKLVKVPEHGITAFVGNSRYGWGAPSADGFGFSEFFQKEYARLLFHEKITNVAALNQLQKLPFIPYQNGDSVYKWCSYELLTLGDSYFHLYIAEPQELEVDYLNSGDNYTLFLTHDNMPVEGVVVSINDLIVLTGHNGIANLMVEPNSTISLYKEGFKFKELSLESQSNTTIIDYQLPEVVSPNSNREISFRIRNGLDIELSWELRVKEGATILGETSGQLLTSGVISDWLSVTFEQPATSLLSLELYSHTANTVVDSKIVNIELGKPEIEIKELKLEHYPLVYGQLNSLGFTVKNSSNFTLNNFYWNCDSEDLGFLVATQQRVTLEPNEEYVVQNLEFNLMNEVDYASLTLAFNLTNDYWQDIASPQSYAFSVAEQNLTETFEQDPTWFIESEWQRTHFYAYEGDYSLSCRPEEYGDYAVDLPLVTYSDDLTLSFMYKHKMPMYGEDGVSIYVLHGDVEERLIFLGSGGALNKCGSRDSYIFGDWAFYSLTLGDLLRYKPETGEEIIIRLSFKYVQDNSVNNDYASLPELGIFIDNLKLSHGAQTSNDNHNAEPIGNNISLYPNPLRNSILSVKHNNKVGEKYEISVYNLKGQKIGTQAGTINNADREAIQLPLFQNSRRELASGIYLVKYKSVDTSATKKILLLK